MDLSVASLFGYRNGSIPVSAKAWSKLEQCEAKAGPIDPVPPESDLVNSAQQFAAGVQSMMLEMAEMRQRLAELEEIVRKGPQP